MTKNCIQIEKCVCGDGKVVGKPHHCYTADDYRLKVSDFHDPFPNTVEVKCSTCQNIVIRPYVRSNVKCSECKKTLNKIYSISRYSKLTPEQKAKRRKASIEFIREVRSRAHKNTRT